MIFDLLESVSRPRDKEEEASIDFVRSWAESGAPMYRTQKPATPPIHLVAYCVLLDPERRHIWLGEHRASKLWLPPGGHTDPGEHPQTTACRELKEELKIEADLFIQNPFFLTITEPELGHTDVSFWYIARHSPFFLLQPDPEEFSNASWFPIDEIPYSSTDRHMARFMYKLGVFKEFTDSKK